MGKQNMCIGNQFHVLHVTFRRNQPIVPKQVFFRNKPAVFMMSFENKKKPFQSIAI